MIHSNDVRATTLYETARQNFARLGLLCPMQMAKDTALGVMKRIILSRVSSSPFTLLMFSFLWMPLRGHCKDKRRRQ
jgi:hypothetical protein